MNKNFNIIFNNVKDEVVKHTQKYLQVSASQE